VGYRVHSHSFVFTVMSIRVQLSRLHSRLSSSLDSEAFDVYSHEPLPTRINVVGGAAQNSVIVALLSNVLGARVFRQSSRPSVTSSLMGAATKAAWCFARSNRGDRLSFQEFTSALAEDRRRVLLLESRGGGAAAEGGHGLDVEADKGNAGAEPVKLAEPDEDEFQNYGAVVTEFLRLERSLKAGFV
jgi:hypothetical protein